MPVAQAAKALLEVATMPEVAVTEDSDTRTEEDHIRPTRQILNVDPVPEPGVPQRPA